MVNAMKEENFKRAQEITRRIDNMKGMIQVCNTLQLSSASRTMINAYDVENLLSFMKQTGFLSVLEEELATQHQLLETMLEAQGMDEN